MSDPVTNHDIEDVLSSIRRLVAQGDTRRMGETPNAAPAPEKTPTAQVEAPVTPLKEEVSSDPAPVDRLVLTPAFRVTPQAEAPEELQPQDDIASQKPFGAALQEPESDVIPTEDDRPIPPPAQSPSERASLEATIAELEAAVNSRSDEWEPDGSEPNGASDIHAVFANKLDAIRPSRFMRHEPEIAEAPQPDSQKAAPATETVLSDAVVDHIAEAVQDEIAEAFPHLTAADEAPETLTETFAEAIEEAPTAAAEPSFETASAAAMESAAEELPVDDNTVVQLTPETAAPRGADAAEDTPRNPTPLSVVPDVPETPEAAETPEADAGADDQVEYTFNGVVVTAPAPGKVAEETPEPAVLEVADSEIDFAPRPNEAPTFRHAFGFRKVYDPVAEATADAAEAAPDAGDIYGDELAPDPDAPGTEVAAAAPAGQLMDPDMVRDMVSQMIREELQGEMGERITRNVRKLVRREINRVLSAQEFD